MFDSGPVRNPLASAMGRFKTYYYNEFDKNAAQWIRNLSEAGVISQGVVDERSIKEVQPKDLAGYDRCHFFAGIAGWEEALRLAGWPQGREIWTGSCPCQSFSAAGKSKGKKDPRHLWPDFFRLIRKCRPGTVCGEQVEGAVKHGWLDGVQRDLEREGYAFWPVVLGAHSASAPHIRQRIYWVAHLPGYREESGGAQRLAYGGGGERRREPTRQGSFDDRPQAGRDEGDGLPESGGAGVPLADPADARRDGEGQHGSRSSLVPARPEQRRADGSVANDDERFKVGGQGRPESSRFTKFAGSDKDGPWSDFRIIHFSDGKARRVGSQVQPLVDGLPVSLGRLSPGQRRLAEMAGLSKKSLRAAKSHRLICLKGSGNAIVPVVAALFISAFMEVEIAALGGGERKP